MIRLTNQRTICAANQYLAPGRFAPLPATVRYASLSAIHRGLRRSERVQYGEPRPRIAQTRGQTRGRKTKIDKIIARTERSLSLPVSEKRRDRLLKKLEKKEDEKAGFGKQTRRKRFVDGDSDFGKNSIVWQLRHGPLKHIAENIDLEEPVRPRQTQNRLARQQRTGFQQERSSSRYEDRDRRTEERSPRREPRSQSEPPDSQRAPWSRPERSSQEPRQERRGDGRQEYRPRTDASHTRGGSFSRDTRFSREQRIEVREDDRREYRPRTGASDASGDLFPRRKAREDGRQDGRQDYPRRTEFPKTQGESWQRAPQLSRQQTQDLRKDLQQIDDDGFQNRRLDVGSQASRETSWKGDANVEVAQARERRGKMMPMTIQYTTAASQFLYGKSAVRSALEQRRRKLYKLYIYGGENRQDSKENEVIQILATQFKVPITIVPTEDQRLMDKMSMGRPHNGFVLEASPLPRLPVVSLGKVEERVGRLGFHIKLDHQSKEEEAVNGTSTFIERASSLTPKPFVLLLNEILDPGNLGALLRTASYMGVDAVGITNRSTAHLSPVVLKSAAGAVEEVTLFTVDDPVKFINGSKEAGWKSYASVAPPSRKLVERHSDKFISTEAIEQQGPLRRDPCILMLGNEGFGLSKPLKMAADYELSVPRFVHHSCVDSLNVSVAAGLLCHSFVKPAVAGKRATATVTGNKAGKTEAIGANAAGSEEAVF